MTEKYLILCVAGQSNAVGFDESAIPPEYVAQFQDDRIRQLGFNGEENLQIIPLGACAQSFQDMRPYGHPSNPGQGTRGIHLPLAHALLPFIPEEYGILVLPCAYGGTGFTVNEFGPYDEQAMQPAPGQWRWGVQSNYYRAMKDRIAHALSLHEGNRFLGVVWCQGEHDEADAEGHKAGFEAMTEDFFRHFESRFPGRVYKGDWNRDIWYNYETVSYWYTQGQCRQIWQNYREWNPDTYIAIPRDTDSNEQNGTGVTASILAAHFGNGAFHRIVAPRVAQAIQKRLR